MTGEELSKLITESNEDIAKNVIPKVVNPIMDIYQKGFELGMYVGKELLIDKACEWLKNNLYDTQDNCGYKVVASFDSFDIPEFIEYFKRAMEKLEMKGEEHPSEDNAHSRKNRKPFDIEWTSKFERIKPAAEFKFREGELVEPISHQGRGYEILARKYIVNDKTAYFCKHLGWMLESELQRYDPNEPKEPTQ